MNTKPKFSSEETRKIGDQLGINWGDFDIKEFQQGLEVELEHGSRNPKTNVTDDDLILTGKIAWAHLNEFPDYYTRLEKLESDAKIFWAEKRKG